MFDLASHLFLGPRSNYGVMKMMMMWCSVSSFRLCGWVSHPANLFEHLVARRRCALLFWKKDICAQHWMLFSPTCVQLIAARRVRTILTDPLTVLYPDVDEALNKKCNQVYDKLVEHTKDDAVTKWKPTFKSNVRTFREITESKMRTSLMTRASINRRNNKQRVRRTSARKKESQRKSQQSTELFMGARVFEQFIRHV